jgi:hypothetical protein
MNLLTPQPFRVSGAVLTLVVLENNNFRFLGKLVGFLKNTEPQLRMLLHLIHLVIVIDN